MYACMYIDKPGVSFFSELTIRTAFIGISVEMNEHISWSALAFIQRDFPEYLLESGSCSWKTIILLSS